MDHYNNNISKIILCQNIVKKKLKILDKINSKLDFLYGTFFSIMKRLNSCFLKNIINNFKYNDNLEYLMNILKDFNTIQRPVSLLKLYNISKIYKHINNIEKKLIILVGKVGGYTLFDTINLVCLHYKINNKLNSNLLKFFNRTFVPICMDIYDFDCQDSNLVLYNQKNDTLQEYDMLNINKYENIFVTNMYKSRKSLIEEIHGARLYIKIKSNKNHLYFVYDGYFNDDPLNLARYGGTLQNKNIEISKQLNNLNINNNFKLSYIEQLSLRDFLIFDINTILERCLSNYNKLKEYKNKTISSLVNLFLKSNIIEKRNILTLFLLMKDDMDLQYLAHLLYDMITNESYLLKPEPIGEKVFNSLHWTVQKLFKLAIENIPNHIKNIKDFNLDELSYEKRIILMKCSEIIKNKALSKLKEYEKSGETATKCIQYLDGILKIPFDIYKEEEIICYLNKYRDNLNTFLILIDNLDKENKVEQNIMINSNKIIESIKDREILSHEIDNYIENINKLIYKNYTNQDIENIKKIFERKKKTDIIHYIDLLNSNSSGKINISIQNTKKKNISELIKILKDKDNNIGCLKGFIGINCDFIYKQQYFNLSKDWYNYKLKSKKYIYDVKNTLDNSVYKQEYAKKEIQRIIAQWINGKNKGYCFGFEGPPGVGKTSLAKKGISMCLKDKDGVKRPFSFIALGGNTNGATLEGHSYTYVGSIWGRIVDILMETECMNPIIYIDELDKVSNTEHGKEIIGILTHLTDYSQNDEFMDKYFSGIKLDLSKVLFIFSYNDYSLIDPILLDRIHRIKFEKLSKSDKLYIIQNFILPEICDIVGFEKNNIKISKKNLEFIIESYTNEAGVRKLKEILFEIVREINLRYIINENINFPYTVTKVFIDNLFKHKNKISIKKIHCRPMIGIVNGLYATITGLGGITIIESFKTPHDSKLSLVLTGQQGNIMQESMNVAKTVAWNIIPNNIKNNIYNEMKKNGNFGIHLHCPEGSTPKDGPSAGAAITVAIISLLTNTKIDNKIAITGEIDLNGSIHAIGGLESKINGAIKADVETVLFPSDNKEDLKNMNDKIENIKLVPVKNIWEVLDIMIIENNLEFHTYT